MDLHARYPALSDLKSRARARIPLAWTYAVMRRFHGPSSGVMVATASLRRELDLMGR